jgi:hypothetical protein
MEIGRNFGGRSFDIYIWEKRYEIRTFGEKNQSLNTLLKAEMNFDGLREGKVPPPGGVLRLYVEDRASSAATGARNSVSFISWKHNQRLWFTKQGAKHPFGVQIRSAIIYEDI